MISVGDLSYGDLAYSVNQDDGMDLPPSMKSEGSLKLPTPGGGANMGPGGGDLFPRRTGSQGISPLGKSLCI